MQNLPAQSVTTPEKVRCLRNNTPNHRHPLTDLKTRQSSKIREIGEALISTGFVSLDAQAKILGLPRSTAWTILAAEHKGTGISARTMCRMLSSAPLPATCSGENHGIREGKSRRYLRWYGDAAPQICLEARIERPGRMAYPTSRCAVKGFTPLTLAAVATSREGHRTLRPNRGGRHPLWGREHCLSGHRRLRQRSRN